MPNASLGKVMLRFLYTEIRERTRERPRIGNIRIGAAVKALCFVRKLRIAQLRLLTISGHVIAVSAQQRDNEKGVLPL